MHFPDGISLKGFSVFSVVCTSKTMAEASKKLGMTQPAVSQHITRMENALGVLLIDRSSRPHSLTNEGRLLEERLDFILRDISKTMTALKHIRDGSLLNVRLSIPTSMVRSLNSNMCYQLKKRFNPDCVQISIDKSLEMEKRLVEGDIDFALSTKQIGDNEHWISIPILKEGYLVVLPRDYGGPSDTLHDISSNIPYIGISSKSTMASDIRTYFSRIKFNQKASVVFDTPATLLDAVESGEGFSILTPLCLLESPYGHEKVKYVRLPGTSISRTLYLIYSRTQVEEVGADVAEVTRNVFRDNIHPRLLSLSDNDVMKFEVLDGPRNGSTAKLVSHSA